MFEILTQVALPISLILIMAGVGMGLTPADFGRVIAQPKAFVIGAVCQMVLLPLIAIGIIELTGLTGPWRSASLYSHSAQEAPPQTSIRFLPVATSACRYR